MRITKSLIHPAALFVAVILAAAAHTAGSGSFPPKQGLASHVFDGDTLLVESGGARYKVRILGINTPEVDGPYRKAEPYGKEASIRTKALVEGKYISLEYDSGRKKDKYGRLLAYVRLPDGVDLGRLLISEGLAEAFHTTRYSRKTLYHRIEQEARQARLGIWSLPKKRK